jgi:IS5 family transposase
VGKIALIQYQRYAHAKQFRRANRALKSLRTLLGRVIRDIARKMAGRPDLAAVFALPLSLARRVKDQRQRERGRKVYSLHAPEVECIGKGKAHKPYEFGVKVSVATPLHRCRGGQFVAHIKAMPGNPYDGHTLATVIPALEQTIGVELERVITDAGYKGHKAPAERRFRVYVAGQKRRLTATIKRAFKRRSAIEPVIGHLKGEHRLDRNHLAHGVGDAINAVLAAVGYNFRLLIRWLAFLCALLRALLAPAQLPSSAHQPA